MILNLFEVRSKERLHPQLYRLTLGCFALVRCWDSGGLAGPLRGRAFENAFYVYCDRLGLSLTERAGARTLRGTRSASGLRHESDGVVAGADLTVHLELKHLTVEVAKADLMIFNQKGLDFLAADDLGLRRRPLYRVFVSGRPVSPEARSFALLWGIVLVEPDRLPFPLVHWLLGSSLATLTDLTYGANRGWAEIPHLISPLQDRLRRFSRCLDDQTEMVALRRRERALEDLQLADGDCCWAALDALDPAWLDDAYERVATPLAVAT